MDPKERRKHVIDFALNGEHVVNPDNLYKPRDGDIIAVGPMKSGTTWLQQILHQIRTKGDETLRDIYDVTWCMLNPSRQWDFNLNAEQKFTPRVFKHHEPYGVIQSTNKQKIVVIVRDPYDAAFSMAKFFSGFYGDNEGRLTDEEMAEVMRMTKNTCANFATLSSWWEHRNDPNVLFLFYEDLTSELEQMIRKIAAFVEIPLTTEQLHKICYLCSLEYMARHTNVFQGDSTVQLLSHFTGIETWSPKAGSVRKDGIIEMQGLEKLAPMLRATIDQLWQETFQQQHGYKSYQELHSKNGAFAKN